MPPRSLAPQETLRQASRNAAAPPAAQPHNPSNQPCRTPGSRAPAGRSCEGRPFPSTASAAGSRVTSLGVIGDRVRVGKPAVNTAPTCFRASLAHRRCPFQRQISCLRHSRASSRRRPVHAAIDTYFTDRAVNTFKGGAGMRRRRVRPACRGIWTVTWSSAVRSARAPRQHAGPGSSLLGGRRWLRQPGCPGAAQTRVPVTGPGIGLASAGPTRGAGLPHGAPAKLRGNRPSSRPAPP
jgi:hypothetical protein